MEFAMTKMSQNGQIVIPLEIRREAKLKPASKFMIISEGENIILKKINEDVFKEEMRLIKIISRAEEQIKEGKVINVDLSLSTEELIKSLKKKK
ncbi:MAG: AbrB/MazE/SpoVT family DNA-binding domain-containing protein [Candidatus Nanoarchaeia archaeon]